MQRQLTNSSNLRLARVAAAGVGAVLALTGCGASGTSKGLAPPKTHRRQSRTFADVVQRIRSGVVRIEVSGCGQAGVGTGFIIGNRLVATVEHVVDQASSITLKQNGRVVARGTVIGSDPVRDLALVRTDRAISGHRFRLASRAPKLGEDVAALGFPLGLPLTVTRGSVSGSDRTVPIDGIQRRKLVQTDAAVNPGNSGGPLITDSGTVVGLVDLGTAEANGLAFAVSAQVAHPLLSAWETAPQPVSEPTCNPSTPSTTQAAGSSGGASTTSSSIETYPGTDFTIDYPAGFAVTAAEVDKGTYYDTTISSGSYLIRVDENPNGATGNIDTDSAPVIDGLRREAGYQEISLEQARFEQYDALRWEFEVPEGGVLLHKVDIFFVGDTGAEWAILTQAPASQWGQVSAALDAIANSFAETG